MRYLWFVLLDGRGVCGLYDIVFVGRIIGIGFVVYVVCVIE